MKKKTRKRLVILVFLLPSICGFIFFQVFPIVYSFILSLTDWDVLSKANFLGFENYKKIFGSEEFWRVLINTLYYIVLYIPLMIIASLSLSMLLNIKTRFTGVFRTIFYIPVLSSWVAAAMLWRWLLSPYYGPINSILGVVGLQGPSWLYDKVWAMPGIVLASVWKDMGFFGLIFLAGLQGINPTYYEVASIDGARRWQKFRHITIPLISPTMFFVLIMAIINSFQLFPQVMVMTKGGPHGSTQVMMERIYNYAFTYYKMGYATALSWVLFCFILVVTLVQWKMQRKWVHYES